MRQLEPIFFLVLLCTSSLLASPLLAQPNADPDRQSVAVTIYNNDLGVVRDVRRFNLKAGTGQVEMRDVPSRIDPTTVKITDPAHPKDIDVIEQNYEYDLVSQEKLLQKYIDKTITVNDGIRSFDGTLLAVEKDKITLQTTSGIQMLPNSRSLTVPMLAGGLITKPTLIWQIKSAKDFTSEPLEVLYQTGGMTWHAEYIAALADNEKTLDLTGWVSVDNTSGAAFPDAKLKLVAGALHRVTGKMSPMQSRSRANALEFSDAQPQFEERGMFEYHIYDLGRQTDIKNNEVKQISLLGADGVGAEKHYTYEGGTLVAVTIQFQNSEANHLGIPMPSGTIRVMKRDKDGSLEFVGEDHIEHTPRDEKLTLHVGNAFDLTGTRETTNSSSLGSNANEESIAITLKNHKDEDVTIDDVENVGTNWEITQSSIPYDKKDAYTIIFHVPVKARGEAKVTYTVRHRW